MGFVVVVGFERAFSDERERERERRYNNGSRIVVEDAPSRVRRDDDL